MRNVQIEKKQKIIISFRIIFLFCLALLACFIGERIFFNQATINSHFLLGTIGNNTLAIILSVLVLLLVLLNVKKIPLTILSIFCAGVASNIIERIAYGGVLDYFNLWKIPTFNIADLLIGIAAMAFIYQIFKKSPAL